MDNLRDIVHSLEEEELREFRTFINRQKSKRNRKDLELFEVLCEDEEYKASTMLQRLYPKDKNKEAYHALRKRLFRHLSDFIVMKRMDDDTTAASKIMGTVSVAQYLFDKRMYRLAWNYLRKAEDLATKAEEHNLLHMIYNLQVRHANHENASALDEIIEKRENNKLVLEEEERAVIANAVIRQRLEEAKRHGSAINFDEIIHEVLDKHGLSEALYRKPGMLYNIISIIRSAIIARKDYFTFEPYVIDLYTRAETAKAFSIHSHYYKLSFLYMIAHVLYRNKKFTECLQWLGKLEAEVNKHKKAHYNLFYPKYLMLYAQAKDFQGLNYEAIETLEKALEGDYKFEATDTYNMQLNLTVFYFQKGDFRRANQQVLSLGHTDSFLEKKMGREWVLKKNLIEMLIQYELGNDDIATTRLNTIERKYKDMFKAEPYARVSTFLKLVRRYFRDPFFAATAEFMQEAATSIDKQPHEREDIQAMGFYSWLKSKMENRNYYKVLLETANELPVEED